MAGKYIATRLHQALDLAPDEPFLARCAALPHYVIDKTLVDILTRSDVRTSILAMKEAGIARLPFAAMVMEADTGAARSFVLLEEYQDHFRASMAVLHPHGALEIDDDNIEVDLGTSAFEIRTARGRSHETWLRTVGVMTGIALLMLNIQGVEKEVIEPKRLNRQRVARGDSAVPTHTVVRIGHVYDQRGNRVGVGAGRQMPVHLRSGHARRQHYGENNSLVKYVYIPPVLVNFKPGAEAPTVPKRVIAA